MATWRDVRRIAMTLPGTIETSEPGKYAWTVNKKMLALQRPLRKGDIAALGKDAPTGGDPLRPNARRGIQGAPHLERPGRVFHHASL